MLSTYSGRIASIKEGKMIQGAEGLTPVIDFYLALDRGNYKKRISLVDGKEYDSDLYRVTIYGQQAISFHKYAVVGRKISIGGRLVQEEFVAKKQIVQIDRENPAFPYLAQLVGKVQGIEGKADGNIYMLANHAVNRTHIICHEHRWEDKNPNGNTGFTNFQPQDNSNFSNTGFGSQPQVQGFGVNPPVSNFGAGFGAPSTPNVGFGTPTKPAQAQGFGMQSGVQSQGFGGFVAQSGFQQQAQAQGFGMPVAPVETPAVGFGGVQYSQGANPQTPQTFAGFGAESSVPQGFEVAPTNNGFAMPNEATTSFSNFTPEETTNANANVGFTPVANNTSTTVATETNIPPVEKVEENKTNQGF